MRFAGRTALAVVMTAAALAYGSAGAAAATINPGGIFTATSPGAVPVRLSALGIAPTCSIAFRGAMYTTYALPLPATIAQIAAVNWPTCSSGVTVAVLLAPPWDVRLTSLTTIPAGGTIVVQNVQFSMAFASWRCLFRGDLPFNLINGSAALATPGATFTSTSCGTATLGPATWTISPPQTL